MQTNVKQTNKSRGCPDRPTFFLPPPSPLLRTVRRSASSSSASAAAAADSLSPPFDFVLAGDGVGVIRFFSGERGSSSFDWIPESSSDSTSCAPFSSSC